MSDKPKERLASCVICEKKLLIRLCPQKGDDLWLQDAGYMITSFRYGSRHDMGGGDNSVEFMNKSHKDKLLSCDSIRFYICDDCFEQKYLLAEGYNKTVHIPEVYRVV